MTCGVVEMRTAQPILGDFLFLQFIVMPARRLGYGHAKRPCGCSGISLRCKHLEGVWKTEKHLEREGVMLLGLDQSHFPWPSLAWASEQVGHACFLAGGLA